MNMQHLLPICLKFFKTAYRNLQRHRAISLRQHGFLVKYDVECPIVAVNVVQPERGWEVDLEDLASRADDDTSCIIFNNPSNPCGSVYSRRHLREILHVAERLRLPVIADEIYADFVSLYLKPNINIHAADATQLDS